MGLWHTRRRRKRREEPWNTLVAHHIPESEEAESFRILRTNLFFRGAGEQLRPAAIVSPSCPTKERVLWWPIWQSS